MNIRETFSYFNMTQQLKAVGPGNTATQIGADVDRQGYDSLTFHIHVQQLSAVTSGAGGGNSQTSCWFIRVQHQDGSAAGIDASTAYADVGSIDVIRPWSGAMVSGATAAGIALWIINSTMSETVQRIGYRGNKRFVRCLLSFVNMTTGASNVITATSMLGHAENWPVAVPNLDA